MGRNILNKPRLAVDFDGTIYDGKDIFPGCIEVLKELQKTRSIAIFSARATDSERRQMKQILDAAGVPYDEILGVKPEADFFIDDKGIRFTSWKEVSEQIL